MSLLDEFKQEFYIMNKAKVSDGEGGYTTTWSEGATISVVVAHDTTIEAQKAEREGTASTYTFLVDKATPIEYHDVLKNTSSGKVYRVTSNSMDSFTPPNVSKLNLTKVTAERWELS